MKKYWLWAALMLTVLVGVGYYVARTAHYTSIIAHKVAAIETKLVHADALIARQELTAGLATVARAQLVGHLDVVRDLVLSAETVGVSKKQEEELLTSLERLNRVLAEHADTIEIIEITASPGLAEHDRPLDSIRVKLSDLVVLLQHHVDAVSAASQ